MNKFFKITILLLLVGIVQIFARPSIQQNSDKHGLILQRSGKIGEGKWSTLSRTDFIQKVDAKYYRQNAVYVKLKGKAEISQDKKAIKNPSIQSTISNLAINSIATPFEKYINVAQEADKFGVSRIYQINYDLPVDPYLVCEDLLKNPDVEYATPIFIRYTSDFTPNDPRFAAQEQYYLDVIKMRPAWDITKGSKTVKIAIVDSAIDWLHEDLADNIWTNPNEIAGNNIDDDGNGFVDDIHGWDFIGNITGGGQQFKPDNDPKSSDPSNHHGTHVSGCASAVTNNSKGIASPGFSCSIIPIKVSADLNSVGGIIAGYEGILYAANLGADVINCSWGGPGYSPAEEDIVNTAIAKGSVVVVAAGNSTELVDNNTYFPASFPNAFTVGSSNSAKASTFSGYGVKVDVFCPGENIMSTIPGNSYSRESGTSMASPIIAGLFGLLKSIHPDWTPKQLMHQIRATAVNSLVTNQNDRPYYFGMANALAALSNNNQDPNKTNPGISMESVLINGKTAIEDYEDSEIKASFKNYLSPANNVEITFIPQDKWLVIDNPTTTIPAIGSNELKDATLNVRITEDCPWFSGTTRVIVKIVSGTYTNFELITLPINLPSNNTFGTKISALANIGLVQLNALQMMDESYGWVAANDRLQNQGIFAQISGTSYKMNFNSPIPCYAVYGFDANKAIMGTGSDDAVGNSSILKTTNGGTNWTTINTSTITGFINFVHFYDDNNGIFLGDSKGTTWGCATTTDGGSTWKLLTTLPQAYANEDGLVGSGQFEGDEIWFGTTMGRIFYSPDRGQSWSVSTVMSGKAVIELNFMSKDKGLVILADDLRATSNRYLASTSDGMINWKVNQNINFTALGLYPIYSFSPAESNKTYLLFSSGVLNYSDDGGNTWKPELTKKYSDYVLADHMFVNGKVRVWHLGYGLSYLDFVNRTSNPVKKIALAEGSPVDFGNVQINKTKAKFIKLQNTGNTPTAIISGEIIPGENTVKTEFEIKATLPASVDVAEVYNFRTTFNPSTPGNKKATIKLLTDGEPAYVEFEVSGVADPLSVFEIAPIETLSINPNPATSNAIVRFNSKTGDNSQIVLYDNLNKKVISLSKYMNEGINEVELELNDLSRGMYILVITIGDKNYACKLLVK